MKEIIVVGNGKLATEIIINFNKYSDLEIKKYNNNIISDCDSMFVHLGSGREFYESLKKAKGSGSAYIQAATEKDIKMNKPSDNTIIYISAPNLDINIIRLFHMLKKSKNLFIDEEITILESHQKEKTSEPGTAYKICDYLDIDKKQLKSIRDIENQKQLGIQNLKQHAYHKIEIGNKNSNIKIETKIEGSLSYVKGLSKIVEVIKYLDVGNYDIDDLIDLNLL